MSSIDTMHTVATATKEHGMLLSAPMVLARLAGTKTQTRRIVIPQPHSVALVASGNHLFDYRDDLSDYRRVVPMEKAVTLCPHGRPGDRVWWREAWRCASDLDSLCGSEIEARCLNVGYRMPWAPIQYEADKQRVNWEHTGTPPHDGPPKPGRYRHARFMPRWAARLVDEITEVRVQRLQEISEVDAIAEGVERTVTGDGWRRYCAPAMELAGVSPCITARDSYHSLWDSINGHGSWDANPWVWAISFRRVNG